MNILVVDDNKLIVEDILDELKTLAPNSFCLGTTDSLHALELNKENNFDIVISDIEMPGMNGITLARKLIAYNPRINIIFITGYSEYALESYSLYASAFLTKPISSQKLKDALDNLRYPVCSITDEMISAYYNGESYLGKKIEKYREDMNISRKDLAELMDVSVQTVYRWENGARIPDVITFMKLARILGTTMDDLIS